MSSSPGISVVIRDFIPVNSSRVLRLVSGISRVVKHPISLKVRTSCTKGIHEKSEDFHKMVDPGVGSSFVLQCAGHSLSHDGANLTGTSGDTVSCGSVSRREDFTRYNKGGGVGSEVLEEVAETVKSEKSASGNDVVSETDDTKQDGENNEAH